MRGTPVGMTGGQRKITTEGIESTEERKEGRKKGRKEEKKKERKIHDGDGRHSENYAG